MLQRILIVVCLQSVALTTVVSQSLPVKLETAFSKLMADPQFKHATIGFMVTNNKTGSVVFERNSQAGLAPASCQKILTSIAALELLGKDYRYQTYLHHSGSLKEGRLRGNLYVSGTGDPTMGSKRWNATAPERVMEALERTLRKNNIQVIEGDIVCDDLYFSNDPVPHGWVWEDMGNYYGAGAWGFNWRENQFDLTFKTSAEAGGPTQLQSTSPAGMLSAYSFINRVTTGPAGSGDNAYLFSAPFHPIIAARGTVPPTAKGFTISGSIPDPPGYFVKELKTFLSQKGIQVTGDAWSTSANVQRAASLSPQQQLIDSIASPTLDSINYWFLKSSVNLFGEAFVKSIAFTNTQRETTEGIALLKAFWAKQGIPRAAVNVQDGSGLSPANRVTAHALVTALRFATTRPWYASFYNALPEMNGIKMKDGYIGGVRSYTGYIKRASGEELVFALIANNFDGSAATARTKMWNLLNALK